MQEKKHPHDVAKEFVSVVRILDHHLRDDADEKNNDGICNIMSDARDIKAYREITPR